MVLGLFTLTNGTTQTLQQNTYWTRFYVRVKLDDTWSWQIEADNRRFFGENRQLQFIMHTHIHRKISRHTEGSAGISFSQVWQGNLAVPEPRLFQEFYVFNPIGEKFKVSHRFRTEQRWFHNFSTEELTSGYNFKFRFRYMIRLEYKWMQKWILKANDEVLYHHDDFDQNRYYGGIEYKFNPYLSLEVGYLKVYQKRANNKGYFDRDNLRVTAYKDF